MCSGSEEEKRIKKSALPHIQQQGACEMDFGGVGGQIFYEINRQTCYNSEEAQHVLCLLYLYCCRSRRPV
jgi:hypothetical protein